MKSTFEIKYEDEDENCHLEIDLKYQTRIIGLLSDQILGNDQKTIKKLAEIEKKMEEKNEKIHRWRYSSLEGKS